MDWATSQLLCHPLSTLNLHMLFGQRTRDSRARTHLLDSQVLSLGFDTIIPALNPLAVFFFLLSAHELPGRVLLCVKL